MNCDFSNCMKEGWKNSGLYRIQSRVSRAALVEAWIISCFFSTVAVITSHLRKLLLYFIYMLMRDLRGNFGTLFNCTECRYYLLVEWPYLADCYFNSRHKKTNNKRSLRWENVSFALKQKKQQHQEVEVDHIVILVKLFGKIHVQIYRNGHSRVCLVT